MTDSDYINMAEKNGISRELFRRRVSVCGWEKLKAATEKSRIVLTKEIRNKIGKLTYRAEQIGIKNAASAVATRYQVSRTTVYNCRNNYKDQIRHDLTCADQAMRFPGWGWAI